MSINLKVDATEVALSEGARLETQDVLTGRGCVIGQSGSGKSFLVGVIAEELSKSGMPFCIIDTEGEYGSIKGSFNAIVVGGESADLALDVDYSELFSASVENGIPVILDLVGKRRSHIGHFVLSYKINEQNRTVIFVGFEHLKTVG